jgi:hypothetical protein
VSEERILRTIVKVALNCALLLGLCGFWSTANSSTVTGDYFLTESEPESRCKEAIDWFAIRNSAAEFELTQSLGHFGENNCCAPRKRWWVQTLGDYDLLYDDLLNVYRGSECLFAMATGLAPSIETGSGSDAFLLADLLTSESARAGGSASFGGAGGGGGGGGGGVEEEEEEEAVAVEAAARMASYLLSVTSPPYRRSRCLAVFPFSPQRQVLSAF